MNVTEAIRAAIRADGRSLHKLGADTGVSKGVLSRFMRGERAITVTLADRIIRGLGLDCRLVRRRGKMNR